MVTPRLAGSATRCRPKAPTLVIGPAENGSRLFQQVTLRGVLDLLAWLSCAAGKEPPTEVVGTHDHQTLVEADDSDIADQVVGWGGQGEAQAEVAVSDPCEVESPGLEEPRVAWPPGGVRLRVVT